MKQFITAIILLGFIACKQKDPPLVREALNQDNLEIQAFVINTKKDTTIKTSAGILIQINAGSIESPSSIVTLQVKEALSIYDMIKANLTTRSDKGLLSSDGMFYIDTKEKSTIKKSLHISLPAAYANKNMRLYKGAEEDNKVVWTDPKPIQTKESDCIEMGKSLFTSQCAACHAIDKRITGPEIINVEKRWPDKNKLRAFIRDNQAFLKTGDKYANDMYCEYNKTAMNLFPNLTDQDIDCILNYIRSKSPDPDIAHGSQKTVDDSCEYYIAYYQTLTKCRDTLTEKNGFLANVSIVPPDNKKRDTAGVPLKVNPPIYNAEYYQFDINSSGWYNIDIALEQINGVEMSKLFVQIQNKVDAHLKVFLVIPTRKIFDEGGFLDDNKRYGFYKGDGSIPLPQEEDAFILALGEHKGKLLYGEQYFLTGTTQTINISVKETTKTAFLKSLEKLHFNNTEIQVRKTKNFEGIKAADSEISRVLLKLGRCADPCSIYSDTSLLK
ncbi:c-type cytochrome [Chitinophagaceae bacterium LWZ2-11]